MGTLAPTISATGISAPDFNTILAAQNAAMRGIFGSDIYLDPSSQDEQAIAAFCMANNDANQAVIAVYNSYSPTFAQGTGLSGQVKINGLSRLAGTNSTAPVQVTGVAGVTITNGVVGDGSNNLYDLPPIVTIPNSGEIIVTATAQQPGAIASPINTIENIITVFAGWQSVTNTAASTPGSPTESDAALRQRQSTSTAQASQTPLQAIAAQIANTAGVERSIVYENQTSVPDANGIPGHSIAAVVQGGSVTDIANAIQLKKSPGTGTYGTTSEIILDQKGVPITINFFELAVEPIFVSVAIHPLLGYVAQDGIDLVNAIVDFINNLAIGQTVYYNWIFGPANNYGNPEGLTYVVKTLHIGLSASPTGTADIPILFNQAASCIVADVVLTEV